MDRTDSRGLSDDALIERRRQVVRCRLNGLGLKDSAAQCGMSRHAANRAWQLYKKKGWKALETRRTGRPEDSGQLVTDEQQQETQRLSSDKRTWVLGCISTGTAWNSSSCPATPRS